MSSRKALILSVVSALCFAIFSLPAAPTQYGRPFEPASVRSLAMGGTGIAKSGSSDAYYLNPASLCYYDGQLSVPFVSFTIYNSSFLSGEGFFNEYSDGDRNKAANILYDSLRPGKNMIAKLDLGLDLAFSGFGMGLNVQLAASNIGTDKVFASTSIYGFLALAQNIEFSDDFALSFGLNAKFHYLAYTLDDPMSPAPGGMGSDAVKTAITDPKALLSRVCEQSPVAGGFAIPLDIGISCRIWDNVYFGLAMRNINASFKNIQTYSNLSSLVYELTGSSIGEITPEGAKDSFRLQIPSSLDFGLSWAPVETGFFSYVRPCFSFDFVDTIGYFGSEDLSWSEFLSHVRLGAELRLFQVADLRAGLSAGYPSLGVGFDLFAIRCDIVYAVYEFGSSLGENPVDGVTVRFNIGFDR